MVSAVVPLLLQCVVAQGGHKSVFIASPPKNVRLKWREYICAGTTRNDDRYIPGARWRHRTMADRLCLVYTRYTRGIRGRRGARCCGKDPASHIYIYIIIICMYYILYNRSDYCLGFCAPPPSNRVFGACGAYIIRSSNPLPLTQREMSVESWVRTTI